MIAVEVARTACCSANFLMCRSIFSEVDGQAMREIFCRTGRRVPRPATKFGKNAAPGA